MITIQNVGEALHLIETQVFKDLEVNPFRKDKNDLEEEIIHYYKDIWLNASNDDKEVSIKLAALLTRLISELP